MKYVKDIRVITWFLIFLPQIALAGDVFLDKIVVTPSRNEESYNDICRSVDIVTADDIQDSGAQDLSQALTDITSVNISDYGSAGNSKTIRMRGSTANQVLILSDGRPLNNPRDGQVDLSNLTLDNIDKIEVLHGPGSSLYGTGAMGGIINIITKKPPKEGTETKIFTGFGTFRTYTERLSHGGRIANFGYLLNGSYESSVGSRQNSEFNAKNFDTKFEYKINDENNLNVSSGFYNNFTGLPGPTDSPSRDDKQKTLKNFIDLGWRFNPDETATISAKFYNNYDRLEFVPNSPDSIYDTSTAKSIQATQARGYNLQISKKFLEKYLAIAGFDYTGNFNDSTTTAKHKYNVRAYYLENQFDLLKSLKMTLGARVDDYSNFGAQFDPSFSLLYKINKDDRVRISVSRSFRAPTFNDLYWPDEVWSKGNPLLKPEKGATAELGYEARVCKYLDSSLTYYRSNYSELINWAPDNAGVWTPTNIGSAVIQGAEFQNRIYLPANFEFDLGYTYLWARDTKEHKFLIYQPRDKIDFSLKFNDLKGLTVAFKGQFTGQRYHNADNTIKVKQFFVFGLSASKKFKHGITYYASIENMLARKYQVIRNYPMPGFSITNSLQFEF